MTDKVLALFDMEWIHFGIASRLKHLHDCDLFGIIDIDYNMKIFFENQDIVKLEQQWYYRDSLREDTSVDVDFLKSFEESYNLDLWKIAYSERFFSKDNPYHRFTHDEILSILYKECKLFDSIIKEVNPDFLLIKFTDSHQSHLLHQMCNAKQIKTLMLGPTRLGGRFTIYDKYEVIDDFEVNDKSEKQRTDTELKNYIENYNALKTLKPHIRTNKKSFFKKLRKYFRNLKLLGEPNVTDYYAHYGKTKFNVIKQLIFVKRWYRTKFIENFFKKTIDNNTKFIYYPLHVDPERQTLIVAPFFLNQIENITHISKSLPIGFKLYVKEHGMMEIVGWRSISYYKEIMNLPNVELIHPKVDPQILLDSCSMVVTINGTTGLEALFHKKPVVAFSNVSYSGITGVSVLNKLDQLPEKIKSSLKTKVNSSELNDYINLVERNTFEMDMTSLYLEFGKNFSKEYNTAKSSMTVSQMKNFIDKNIDSFDKLAKAHVAQIKKHHQRGN